jgi:2-polyprenyl-3-methyl-5-hydroxy-6-metoxy-1,4-benzoquinol methylase
MNQIIGTEKIKCDLCGADNFTILYQGVDRLHHLPGSFPVVRCKQCELVYLNPRPDPLTLPRYYPEDYSPYHTGNNLTNKLQYLLRKREAARISQILPKGGRVLEVGCASGDLLTHLKNDSGLDVAGIEMSEHAAETARSVHGLNIHTGTLFDAPYNPKSFDAIVMRHVVEHFPSPRDSLQQAALLLKPGGVLLISTPNFDSLDRYIFGRFWHDLDTPRHLVIFSVDTLRHLLKDIGFETRQVNHSLVPNNWIHSIRNLLEAGFGRRRIFNFFSIKNPIALCLFLPASVLQKLLRKSGRMEVIAVKSK